jgi:hypothetical protein
MRCSRARRVGRDGEKARIIAFQYREYYYLLPVAHVLGGRAVHGGRHSEHRGREGVSAHHAGILRDDRRTMIANGMTHLEPSA